MESNVNILPAEVQEIAKNVSMEKRNEVQTVLNHVFNGVSKMREQLDSVTVSDPNDKVNMKLANTIRLGVRQVRLEAEKTFDAKRSEVQAQMLSYKTEDQLWLKAKQTMQILTKEIEEQARWKEETKARFEAEQRELVIQQRIMKISKIAPEIQRAEIENMTDEVFEIFYAGIEKAYNDRIEAEKKAEAERIAKEKAEAEERERIRKENERLKAEAERIEKEREAERKKQAEILAKQQAEAKEKARIEAEKQAKIQAELKAKAEAERKEKERIEKELQAQKEEKERIERERIEAEKKAKNAPEKEKLLSFSEKIKNLQRPEINTDDAKKIIANVNILLDKVVNYINENSEKL